MVKPDIKRNYYADLELSSDATLDDIKRQYRKLALKYHPDRNPGKETEIAPKFQIIQAAHEILEDQVTKAKYDADRRKAGMVPSYSARAATSAAKPAYPPTASNPSAYPPPPRRTATTAGTTTWRAQPAGPSGADRFAQFPRPAPTSKREPDKANVFEAFQKMNAQKQAPGGQQQQQKQQTQPQPQPPRPQPKGAFGTSPQKAPRPAPPPRQDTRFPTAEDIRTGRGYPRGNEPPESFFTEADHSGWERFRAQNAGKPGMARSNTTRAPRKSGFDPMSGGDERQASSTANYTSFRGRTRSDDTREFPPPPPPPPPPHPFSENTTHYQYRPYTQPLDEDAPYTEGIRIKTPYSSHIGQQKYTSSDNLRRANSSQDTTRAHPTAKTNPPGQTNSNGTPRRPFIVEDSSGDSDSSQESVVTTPETAQPDQSKPKSDFSKNSFAHFARPKRTPIPPSSRTASPMKPADIGQNGPSGTHQTNFSGATTPIPPIPAPQRQPERLAQPAPAEPGKQTMYGMLPNPSATPSLPTPQKKKSNSPSLATWRKLGLWAVPSSVFPLQRGTPALQRDDKGRPAPKFAKAAVNLEGSTSTFDPGNTQTKHVYEKGDAFSLPSAHEIGSYKGHLLASHKRQHLQAFESEFKENDISTGFTFPLSADTFASSTGTSTNTAHETINTTFTPAQWAGTFSANNVFAAAQPTSRQTSPPARKVFKGHANTNVNNSATPSNRPFSQYTGTIPRDVPPAPPSPPQNPVKFNAEEWAKTMNNPTWAFQPDALRADPALPTASRPTSRGGRKSSTKVPGVKMPAIVPKPATATAVEDESVQEDSVPDVSAGAQKRTPAMDDVMDVDMGGVSPGPSPPVSDIFAKDFTASTAHKKEPKFVQVDPPSLRQPTFSFPPVQKENAGPRLDDLASVLPNSSTGEGLADLKDISSTLPFQSKSSTTLPTKSHIPQVLSLPKLPVAPDAPTKLSKQSWRRYCESFNRYLTKYLDFDGAMVAHFASRKAEATELISRGVAELESVGAEKWLAYKRGVEEDERVRMHWGIGNEKHVEAIRGFESVRERVRKLSEGAGLVDA